MKITEARADLAAVLEQALPPNVNVYPTVPDQIAVPAVLMGWTGFTVDTVCAELDYRAEILVVAGRIDLAAQLDRLEELTALTVAAFLTDSRWEVPAASAGPFAVDIAGVTYLALTLATSALVELTP